MSAAEPSGLNSLATLRRFARPRPKVERCELCSLELTPEHRHLLELSSCQLVCCCHGCFLLFSDQPGTRYRQVPRRIQALPDFRMTDAQWESLLIPINMAFFCQHSATSRVVALYPSPAGATESLLPLPAWQELLAGNPVLQEMQPDVEALLVNRVGDAREHYLVSIDECYKLVGLIRAHWRGFSGGEEAWEQIAQFFARLKEQGDA
ncbi:MAG TPA: DUF5947 family protein [Isosphaeraceae bacterium]|nr:DUF5947 family protein [Isosphaeraceae bacterium]